MIIKRLKENVPCVRNGRTKIVTKGRARQKEFHMSMIYEIRDMAARMQI
jgi:hypothetical protein